MALGKKEFDPSKADGNHLFSIGQKHQKGVGGVKKNIKRAIEIYKFGVSKRHPGCCYELGKLYATGKHVKEDIPEARRLLNLAANIDPTGMSAAVYELSRLEANISKQVRVLQQAIALGNTAAKVELAKLLRTGGSGVTQDFIKAEALLKEAMNETSEPSLQEQFQSELNALAKTQYDFMESVEKRRLAEEDVMILFKQGRYDEAKQALQRFVSSCTPRMSLKEYSFCETYIDLIGEKATTSIQLAIFENAIENGLEHIVSAMLKYDRHNTLLTDMHAYFDRVLRHGHAYVLEVLLQDSRMQSLADNLANQFAIVFAVERGYTKCVRILMREKRFNPAISNNRCIKIACQQGFTSIVDMLLRDRRVDPSVDQNICIRMSARQGYTRIVKMLLNHPSVDPAGDISWNGVHQIGALQSAAELGYDEITRLLLCDKRCNVASNDNYAIKHAAANGHTMCVRYLLERKRVDPSAERYYALRHAAANGHADVVSLLLSHRRRLPRHQKQKSKDDHGLSVWGYQPIKDAIFFAHIDVLQSCLSNLPPSSFPSIDKVVDSEESLKVKEHHDAILDCVFRRCHPDVTLLFLDSPHFSLPLTQSTYLSFINHAVSDSTKTTAINSHLVEKAMYSEEDIEEAVGNGSLTMSLLLSHSSNDSASLSSFLIPLFDAALAQNKTSICNVLLDFDRSILHDHAKSVGFLRPGRLILEALGKYPSSS